MKDLTDKLLWKSLKDGDLNAFNILFKKFYPILHGYGLKISKDNDLTDDALQDFFI